MEVGAVKQAFNNEVIQLKKNLNQAKIQVIHKLTRKAKTLTEKKTTDHLKEKNKKKAESAVKEVLIMKKLKPRDIARFIITHKGELNSHLNKPDVDLDKACARLLLHKSLQQKYKSIKNTFGNIPIKDLLMSRQERRKLKKEAKELQKNKKKGKEGKVVNAEGDWNVEDVDMGDSKASKDVDDDSDDGSEDDVSDDERRDNDIESEDDDERPDNNIEREDDDISNEIEGNANVSDYEDQDISDDDNDNIIRQVVNDTDSSEGEQADSENNDQDEAGVDSDLENDEMDASDDNQGRDSEDDTEINTDTLKPTKVTKPTTKTHNFLIPQPSEPKIAPKIDKTKPKERKKPDMKVKENKNKNLKEKLLNRKFKKDADDCQREQKVVDPFFITATGENYLSLAEQRPPDEVKEIHSQGNRKERRAAMFGHEQVFKRRRDDSRQNFRDRNENGQNSNERLNKFDDRRGKFNDRNSYNDSNSHFNNRSFSFNDRSNSKFNERNSNFNDRNSKSNDNNSKFNRNNDRNLNNNKVSNPKEEKLHPSWEAKKKQSGILPFEGKKIVFD